MENDTGQQEQQNIEPAKKGRPNEVIRRRKQRQKRLTAEQYNQLWQAYVKNQDVTACARLIGIPKKVAQEYIHGSADTDNGMDQIHARFVRVQKLAHVHEEYDLARFRADIFKDVVQKQLQILQGDAMIHQRDLQQRLEAMRNGKKALPMMPLDKLVTSVDKLFRIGEHCLGGADQRVEHSIVDQFQDWTEKELVEYWTTGRKPNELKPANGRTIDAPGDDEEPDYEPDESGV